MRQVVGWPATAKELIALQERLARDAPPAWIPPADPAIAGAALCFERPKSGPGDVGDRGWAGAALLSSGAPVATALVRGAAGAPFAAGLLALREGPLLEAALRALPQRPDVVFVNATGRDHPRRAGLALHLGAALDLPTVGVTRRPLLAEGAMPALERGARSPLFLHGERVAHWVCTSTGAQPLVVHGGWRIDADTAVGAVLAACGDARTPEPLRRARQIARTARASELR